MIQQGTDWAITIIRALDFIFQVCCAISFFLLKKINAAPSLWQNACCIASIILGAVYAHLSRR